MHAEAGQYKQTQYKQLNTNKVNAKHTKQL